MKKYIFMVFTICIGWSELYSNEIIPDIPAKEIRNQVAELFLAPEFIVEKNMIVNVLFTFDNQGKIQVLRIESNNSNVKTYVHKYMDNKKIETIGEEGKVYKLPILLKANW